VGIFKFSRRITYEIS